MTVTMRDMLQATRLTRAGRLREATTLLLTGAAPEPTPRPRATKAAREAAGPAPSVIDLTPPASADAAWTVLEPAGPQAAATPSAMGGMLKRMRMRRTGQPAPTPREKPQPGSLPGGPSFTLHHFADGIGARDYKLYVPSGYKGAALPLVVMLHGCTQTPDDFAAGTQMNVLAEAQGILVAYPAQTRAANPQGCWNWFNAGNQRRDSGEPALIAGITRQIAQDYAVDTRRVYVAGLSAGGAAAAVMGMTYPDLYASIGVHSGLACGAARNMISALNAMKKGGKPSASRKFGTRAFVPTIVFHGDRDTTVNPVNGDQAIAQGRQGAAALSTQTFEGQAPGGLAFTRIVESDPSGVPVLEQWRIHEAGHAWSGGSADGSYTEPRGPDASREMLRFFLANPRPEAVAD